MKAKLYLFPNATIRLQFDQKMNSDKNGSKETWEVEVEV